ncbi:hypothetical protein LRS10_04995 [Phenylobacterium sp. J426]|uniref:hypothetical protein n=1 Tax=Phenylobacterium sp. J426 TaxID=2898439 RepID=UPI0021516A3A|nr:hypothetical protein [Phenylobacterium sp. J426]MCR5873589.1 hypothetical protein [Phenylobacterium sp. J426]
MHGRLLLSGTLAAAALSVAAVAATSDRLQRLNVAETEISAEQAATRHQLARLLSVLEQLERDPPPALLVSPEDAKDAVRAAILVKAVTPELQARAQSYANDAGEVMRQRRLAAVQSEALFERESLAAEALPEPESNAGLALRGGGTQPAAGRPQGPGQPDDALARPRGAWVWRAAGRRRAGERPHHRGPARGARGQPRRGNCPIRGPGEGLGRHRDFKTSGRLSSRVGWP